MGDVDVLKRGRDLAAALVEASDRYDAETVRLLCDEVAAHRLARDTMAPGVAQRLMGHRANAATFIAAQAAVGRWAVVMKPGAAAPATCDEAVAGAVEAMAHVMLAAERVPQ